jgi:hypothetical protein
VFISHSEKGLFSGFAIQQRFIAPVLILFTSWLQPASRDKEQDNEQTNHSMDKRSNTRWHDRQRIG